jgi:site-specific recombinase XerD
MEHKEIPPLVRDFLAYHETVKAHSSNTVDEYYLDLRNFLRWMKRELGLCADGQTFEEIDISNVDIDFIRSISLSDIYSYLIYLSRERNLNAASRARKVSSIRSFYKYLTSKAKLLEENPVQDLDAPRLQKSLPRYLTLDECLQLLHSVDGKNRERDYCILMLFLNCGIRISELVGLNVGDVRENTLRVLGKGNKERILYLNDGCQNAINHWLTVRNMMPLQDEPALFVNRARKRFSRSGIHRMLKKRFLEAGLDAEKYSAHKLRHTAATLMLQNGIDVRTLQEVLGHDHLNTTQIYTHIENDDLRVAARANPLGKERQKKP